MNIQKKINDIGNLVSYVRDILSSGELEDHHIKMFEGVDEVIEHLQNFAEKDKKQKITIAKLKGTVNSFIDYLDSDLTEAEKYLKEKAKEVLKGV